MDILPQLLVNGLIAGSIYAICSSGLSLSYGLLRILNFAHGHFMMVGAYAFLWARIWHDCSMFEAALMTALVMIVLAMLSLWIFVRPFSQLNPILPFVTTLALGSILEATVSMTFGVNVQSISKGLEFESLEWYGIFITPLQIFIICSAVVVVGALAMVVHLSSVGRTLRAISENAHAAESLGISEKKQTILVFLISCLLAGFAGVLVGLETNLQPTMGATYTIKAFAAMILGGLGNLWGTIIGSFILGMLENLSIGLDFWGYSLPAGYKDAFAFMVILGMLLIRPEGLFRSAQRKA